MVKVALFLFFILILGHSTLKVPKDHEHAGLIPGHEGQRTDEAQLEEERRESPRGDDLGGVKSGADAEIRAQEARPEEPGTTGGVPRL
jgi:hypothetical protein